MSDEEQPDFRGHEALAEMGKMGLSIYRGVLRDGGNHFEAFNITAAFFAGMNKGLQPAPEDQDED